MNMTMTMNGVLFVDFKRIYNVRGIDRILEEQRS